MKNKIYGGVATVYIILAGVYLVNVWERGKEQYATDKIAQAEMWASEVDVTMVQKLTASLSDEALPEYYALKNQLATWAKTDEKIVFTYLMGRRHLAGKNEFYFFVDNVSHDNPDVSLPGDVYTEASEFSHSVFTEGAAIVEGPLIDRWGVWMSASAPVRAENGEIIASLNVDYNMSDYNKIIFIRFLPHIIGVILLGLILAFAPRFMLKQNKKKK